MARILGGIATSHSPTIGFALDRQKQDDRVWAPIFEAYQPVRRWLAQKKPDVLFFIYNDHVTSFFFDHYSHFTLGIGESFEVADEGGGPRVLPPVKGHTALAQHIAFGLAADDFDLSFFQDRPLDHGCFSPLSMLWPHEPAWPGAIIPLQIGVLQFPIPSARRCYQLGLALRRAIESYPEDLSVVIVATGGLSHQVHGERAGFNNPEWDKQFLDLIEKDPVKLTEMTHADFCPARRAGRRGGDHVAGDAGRSFRERQQDPPNLLSAHDDRLGDCDLSERSRRTDGMHAPVLPKPRAGTTRRGRKIGRDIPIYRRN